MDVRCEKCGTEYEFEDHRITEEGVTVKCSTCGHLFKIRRKSFVLTEPVMLEKKPGGIEGERQWVIRKADGSIFNFKELTTLQKWIVEQKVGRDDEISRSGESWKRLGSIPELASFFQIVDQALAARAAVSAPPTPIYASAPPSQTQPMPAAVPPAVPQPALSSASAPAPAAPVPPPPEAPPVVSWKPEKTEPDTWGEGGADETDDVVEKWRKRSRRKWWLVAPVVLLLLAAGGWYLLDRPYLERVLDKILSRRPALSPQLEQSLEEAHALMLQDTSAGYQQARDRLQQTLQETQGQLPRALLLLSLVHLGRADGARPQVDRMDEEIVVLQQKEDQLKPKDGTEAKGKLYEEIAAVHNQKVDLQRKRLKLVDAARKDLEEARRFVEQATTLEAGSPLLAVVRADYRRVLGSDREQVEKELAPARAASGGDAWLHFVEGAMLADDPGQAAAAEQKLRAALAAEPRLARARMRLARLLLQQKKNIEAMAELQSLPEEHLGRELAQQLRQQLEAAPAPEAQKAPTASEQKDPVPAADYQELTKQALALQDQGRCPQALAAFDKALELKPQSLEALTGKGLCYLDLGKYATAATWFQKALKVNPRYGGAIIGLAESYKYQGNLEQARVFYRQYLDVLPNGPEAAVARSNLE